MQSLEFCKFLLRVLGLWSIDPNSSSILSILRYMGTMIFSAITLVALSMYILFYSDDINETIETGFACFAFATTMFIYCWMIKRKPLINSAITQLDTVIDQRINEGSIIADSNTEILYQKAEYQYTKLGRRYLTGSISIVCFYGMTLMIIPINDAYHGSLDAGNWTTLFKSILPIEPGTLSSFAAHFTLDFVSVLVHFIVYSASSTFHMATTIYVSAMVLDIKSLLGKIAKWNSDKKMSFHQKSFRIHEALIQAIRLHTEILQLTKTLAIIMSGILFIIIANSIVFMAIGLIQIETKTKAAAFEVYVSLNSLMLQSTLIWLFCYHSSLATVHMGHISIYAYSTPWYKLSIGSQKIIQLMIQRSNCRFGYSGFGILQCNLDTLKMMVNSVASYYLLLKGI